MKHPNLFQSYTFNNGVTVSNRLAVAPMTHLASDDNGHITIPGFYDGVKDLPPDILAQWKNLNLTLIDTTEEQAVPSFEDWYWIASIVFTLLAIWELAELTLRLPKTLSRADVARAGRR